MTERDTGTLRESLAARTVIGTLWHKEKAGAVRCFSCGHRCFIPEGRDGICKVRSNVKGELRVPWGYVGGLQVDPIEKKPFFHALPGSQALSFGMLGCDFHCNYCQNWFSSQSLRDKNALARPQDIRAEDLVALAKEHGVRVMTSTYNEPLITSEWAVEIFKQARAVGLKTSYVSNGNGTAEVLEYIRPYVDLYKIDLKGFNDKRYRSLGGTLATVIDTIQRVHAMGFWLEIVTLLIPGFNDDEVELKELCAFIASVSKNIPWHVTAFHEDYKMQGNGSTKVEALLRAGEIAKAAGLNFVYLGNLPGRVGDWENTYCASCKTLLVERKGFHVLANHIDKGVCSACRVAVPGVW